MNGNHEQQLLEYIEDNNNLIYSIVNNFNNYGSKEDLYQVGVVGLINAYHNYDVNRGCKFSTYAYPYIRGEIKRYIREDRGIKVSRDISYLGSRIERAKELIRNNLKREPTTKELADYLEIDEYKIIEALQANMFVGSIDEPINDEGRELTIQDIVYEEEPFDKIDMITFKDEFSKLTQDEKRLLMIRYMQDKTQTETAQIMNISQVQVSRGEQKVLAKLRNKLHN